MDDAAAISALDTKGYVVDIGQLDPGARLALRKEIRSGRVERVRAPLAGLMAMKTHYVRDRPTFERAQAAAAASLRLAISLDEDARDQNRRHAEHGRASRPADREGTMN
jgi:hypothetical protein